MNPTGKKFISLFLVLSVLSINCAYLNMGKARERPVVFFDYLVLEVTKLDGQIVTGHLIRIKDNFILLMDRAGKNVITSVADIEVIRIVSKSKIGKGAGIGGLLGGLIGGVAMGIAVATTDEDVAAIMVVPPAMLVGSLLGTVLGAFVAGFAEETKTFNISKMKDKKIQELLERLRTEALIWY